MSAIDDYSCDAADCQRDAVALVETDDGVRVLLCKQCHAKAETDAVTLASGRVLACDTAGTWFLMPEPVAAKGGAE